MFARTWSAKYSNVATGRLGIKLADMDEPMVVEAEYLESCIQVNRIGAQQGGLEKISELSPA
ncbi:MAG TPA: hypothetical protein EYQ14_01390 [Gammaproteobacteria bacterium]|nr:hypothetical protein [Gammaproteobacteria bacterium]